ncbi:MAG: exodeoxyribonuclease VII small subunit [Oscillospiraceae bacterium]|nr:exodeoxyribonuclease VII small subunit [Oscillospiraceae bacterium]
MATKKEENISFENALLRLEEILRVLEKGSAPLDDSLKMFEEGVNLVRLCNNKLDNAEQKIKILIKNQDGNYDEQDFTKTE